MRGDNSKLRFDACSDQLGGEFNLIGPPYGIAAGYFGGKTGGLDRRGEDFDERSRLSAVGLHRRVTRTLSSPSAGAIN